MVDTAKLETEAKAVAAETESVASGLLEALTPKWAKLKSAWSGWTLRKREIAVFLGLIGLIVAWHFSLDIGRLMLGSYRSAYAYGHGDVVNRADVREEGDIALKTAMAHAPTNAQFNDLEAKVHQIEVELGAVETRLSTPAKSPITTGSIQPKKKKSSPPVKASSSWFGIEP